MLLSNFFNTYTRVFSSFVKFKFKHITYSKGSIKGYLLFLNLFYGCSFKLYIIKNYY